MNQFEKIKKEISEISIDDFVKHFVAEGTADYICSDIKVPHAHCMGKAERNCIECIKEFLKTEV